MANYKLTIVLTIMAMLLALEGAIESTAAIIMRVASPSDFTNILRFLVILILGIIGIVDALKKLKKHNSKQDDDTNKE